MTSLVSVSYVIVPNGRFVGEVVNIIGLATLSNVLLTMTPSDDREAQQPNSRPTWAVLNVFPMTLNPTMAWNNVSLPAPAESMLRIVLLLMARSVSLKAAIAYSFGSVEAL